jgi:hypothetical protein
MAKNRDNENRIDIDKILLQIMSSYRLTRQEYLQLITASLSDQLVTDEQRQKINRIFDDCQIGRMKII